MVAMECLLRKHKFNTNMFAMDDSSASGPGAVELVQAEDMAMMSRRDASEAEVHVEVDAYWWRRVAPRGSARSV